jgi:hypothetical protein
MRALPCNLLIEGGHRDKGPVPTGSPIKLLSHRRPVEFAARLQLRGAHLK